MVGSRSLFQRFLGGTKPAKTLPFPPTNLRPFHEACKPEPVEANLLDRQLLWLQSHTFLSLIKGPDKICVLSDIDPAYEITLYRNKDFGNFKHAEISMGGIRFDGFHIILSPTQTCTTHDLYNNPSLKTLMQKWMACVQNAFEHYTGYLQRAAHLDLQQHPFAQPAQTPSVFHTNRPALREFLVFYQTQHARLSLSVRKQFASQLLEPMRRLDGLLSDEAPQIDELVRIGYVALEKAQKKNALETNIAAQDEADVIFHVALERLTHELLPTIEA